MDCCGVNVPVATGEVMELLFILWSHFFIYLNNSFRLPAEKVSMALLKLKLLEIGEFQKCGELDNIVNTSSVFTDGEGDITQTQILQQYEKIYDDFVAGNKNLPSDSLIMKLQREVIDSFNKEALACKQCDSCGAYSPSLRKDGTSKIFEKPLAKRLRKSMGGMKKSLKVMSTSYLV
jgi:hypothetical protein